jgi:hypothetical protein
MGERRMLRLRAAVLCTMLCGVWGLEMAPLVEALPDGGGVIQRQGFDACSAPSTPEMQAWYAGTPWWWIGVYIGGNMRACDQPNLTAAWLNDNYAGGWRFEPIWVGPQAPCTGFASTFSYDPSIAYQQGRNEAVSAWNTLVALGFGTQAAGTPVVYDLEGFDPASDACRSAATSFVQGWTDQMHVPPAQVAGVYGSGCASHLVDFSVGSPPPDFIWGADWSGNGSTATIACVPAQAWVASQRLKQYVGGHPETWNGVTLNIDTDCANATVAPTGGGTDNWCL